MTATAADTTLGLRLGLPLGLDCPADVLGFARARRAAADAAETDVLRAAVVWAEQHPPESIQLASTWVVGGGDTGIPLAGAGAPLVAEFCIPEFAVALGLSTDAGRTLVAAALELKYRLPRVWARVLAGELAPWRARRISEATFTLSPAGAGFVDAQVAGFAHRIGVAALDRLVQEAIDRFMPAKAQENAQRAADLRNVSFHHPQVAFDGTTHVEADLDLADALDFDAALSRGAEHLKVCGSGESLEVRRAMAVGEMSRRQLALDLTADTAAAETADADTADADTGPDDRAPRAGKAARPRQVVLYVHLSEAALTGTGTSTSTSDTGCGLDLARVENHRQVVTAEQVKGWCANPDTEVVLKPVIDLNEHVQVGAYEVPDRLQEQTALRDHGCVFPWCTRAARRCDSEHCVPHDRGGPTCGCNIAPVCRGHHRLKTHTAWTYTTLEPGSFLWSSPHGYKFLRDHTGTWDVSPDRRHPPPEHPQHLH